eukprot:RCo042611
MVGIPAPTAVGQGGVACSAPRMLVFPSDLAPPVCVFPGGHCGTVGGVSLAYPSSSAPSCSCRAHSPSMLQWSGAGLCPRCQRRPPRPWPGPYRTDGVPISVSTVPPSAPHSAFPSNGRRALAGLVGGPRKHLIVLTHGVFGAASDWDSWVDTWHYVVLELLGYDPVQMLTPQRCSQGRRQSLCEFHNPMGASAAPTFGSHTGRGCHQLPGCHPKGDGWPDFVFEFFPVHLPNSVVGLDALAVKACEQIERYLAHHPGRYDRFSLMGHSLGGVYSKQMLVLRGQPHGRYPRFAALRPMNFITFASPHLASRRTTILSAGLELVIRAIGGRTGQEMLLEDPTKRMCQVTLASVPELRKFANLMTYANTSSDFVVPYCTAALCKGCKVRFSKGGGHSSTHRDPHAYPNHGTPPGTLGGPSGSPGQPLPHCSSPGAGGPTSTCSCGARGRQPNGRKATLVVHGPYCGCFPAEATGSAGKNDGKCQCVRAMRTALCSLPWIRVDVHLSTHRAHEMIILKRLNPFKHRGRVSSQARELALHVLESFAWDIPP